MIHVYKVCSLCQTKTKCYGLPGKKATHCQGCATPEMVNVHAPRCACGTMATFGKRGSRKRTHCAACARDEPDIGSLYPVCPCGKRPSYGYAGKTAIFCASCRPADDPRVIFRKGRLCKIPSCHKRARYGLVHDRKSTHCLKHKQPDMILLGAMCKTKDCHTEPRYNYLGKTKPLYCGEHRKPGMINVRAKCKAEWCHITGNSDYDNYCTHCFAHLFPHDERVHQINTRSKELRVRDYVNHYFDGFVHDKPLWTHNCDCTHRRRIDLRKLVHGTLLCIEVDEHQHAGYDKKDENARYHDIAMVHGGKSLFIRYNPDHPDADLDVLRLEIEKQIKRIRAHKNKKLLEIVYLFYK